MLYKDYLYVAYSRTDVTPEMTSLWTLYRIALDGSSKDEVFRSPLISNPIIHRGYMYFFTQLYEVTNLENGKKIYSISSEILLHRLNLEGRRFKDEEIPLPTKEEITGTSRLCAFGNHLYFTLIENNSIQHPLVYDITTGECNDSDLVTSFTFCNGHIYSASYGYPDNVRKEGEVYLSDYLFRDFRKVLDHVPLDDHVVSDQKYIYVHNVVNHWKDPDTKVLYQVYDPEDMTLLDEFTLPDTMKNTHFTMEPPIVGENYQYWGFEDNMTGEWGLYVWDKSSLGTLHGKPYEQIKIIYNQEGLASDTNHEELVDEYEAELSDWTEEYVEFQPNDDADPARIEMTDKEVIVTFENEAVPSRKEIVLKAWYIQDNTVRVQKLTAEIPRENADPVRIVLPEGGEKFIGARLKCAYYFLKSEVTSSGKTKEYEASYAPSVSAYIGRIKKK